VRFIAGKIKPYDVARRAAHISSITEIKSYSPTNVSGFTAMFTDKVGVERIHDDDDDFVFSDKKLQSY
jgi:hypothetical protein